MHQFDRIETERLLLRRWQDADREPFAALNGDPETLVYFPSTLSRRQSDALVDRIESVFYEQLTLFELPVASCPLTLTQPDGTFRKGPTIWKA